jgi:hypothetical protein
MRAIVLEHNKLAIMIVLHWLISIEIFMRWSTALGYLNTSILPG